MSCEKDERKTFTHCSFLFFAVDTKLVLYAQPQLILQTNHEFHFIKVKQLFPYQSVSKISTKTRVGSSEKAGKKERRIFSHVRVLYIFRWEKLWEADEKSGINWKRDRRMIQEDTKKQSIKKLEYIQLDSATSPDHTQIDTHTHFR